MSAKKLHGRNGLALVTAIGVTGLAGLALVVAPRLAGGARPEADVARLTLPLAEGQTLRILNSSGRINVCEGEGDEASIVVTREISTGSSVIEQAVSLWSPASAHAPVRPVVRKTEQGFEISTLGDNAEQHVTYRVEAKLPRGRNVDIANGNGAIALAGIDGDVLVKSDNGDVRCEDIGGALTAHARNGGVTCRYVAGAADLRAANGAIEFEAIPSQRQCVHAVASNGAIKFRAPGFASGLSATTENGRIVCELDEGDGAHKTLHALDLNRGAAPAEVELHALNGNVYVDTN